MFKNNLSVRTEAGDLEDYVTGNADETNYFWDGQKTVNSLGETINLQEFLSMDWPEKFNRDDMGNLLLGDFLARRMRY